jgi:hypothetical protein
MNFSGKDLLLAELPFAGAYLHRDQTAGHHFKIVLDCIFGVQNYRNELIWNRTAWSRSFSSTAWASLMWW